MKPVPEFTLRLATEADIPALHALIEASVRGLQAGDYTPAQIEGALGTVLGLDTQLIADRTYFLADSLDQNAKQRSCPQGAEGGRNAKPSLAPIADPAANPTYSIRQPMLPRCAPSSCIRISRAAAWVR